MMKGRFLVFLSLMMLLISCGKRPKFQSHLQLDQGLWTYDNSLVLDFHIRDTTEVYSLTLDVEHSVDYPWENLYVKIENVFPNGDTMSRPLSVELADRAGKWQGDCSGAACKATIDLQRSVYFPQEGDYTITIHQFMRQDSIPGISSVGLALFQEDQKDQGEEE